jgi:hypothetical protein
MYRSSRKIYPKRKPPKEQRALARTYLGGNRENDGKRIFERYSQMPNIAKNNAVSELIFSCAKIIYYLYVDKGLILSGFVTPPSLTQMPGAYREMRMMQSPTFKATSVAVLLYVLLCLLLLSYVK